ncbi:MAG: hypothetical protein PHH47_02635 [Gallionella sp.]|nr:hypothetical protein [Gallionella sp.]MDD4946094.1 hypothetical protein [Gallionella sp.]MDD5611902.1 hypothetical protein [Gallionella sp.]
MLLNNKISGLPETDPALDQQQLFAFGLDRIRALSHRLWTDHNIHDPGITMLELLCYALTDLSYRAGFPVADLLATTENDAANMARQFFTPRQILPNRPLTVNDYRKLLIDMKGVNNAWLLTADQHCYADTVNRELLHSDPRIEQPDRPGIRQISLQGLYRVLIAPDDNVKSPAQREALCADALKVLQANRNLGEDFTAVEVVPDQYYALCAELELTDDADHNRVMAAIQFAVEHYLTPPVVNHSLAEMLARRHADGSAWTVDEIFAGPALQCGFVDDAELEQAELRAEIRLSDIICIIMDIPGVRAVRDILINPLAPGLQPDDSSSEPADKWRIKVPAGTRPRLSDRRGRLVCYKRGVPLPADGALFAAELQRLQDAEQAKLDTVNPEDLPIPQGRHRDSGRYHAFQHHFPTLYGLSEQGLPSGADAQRRAQALQLKAYLLFFDQAMADFCAQLANLRELYSREPEQPASYFTQRVSDLPDIARIYAADITDQQLHQRIETLASAQARRNRFVDHLLARVAEDFGHYVSLMQSAFGTGAASALATKYAFLQDCPELGAARALGYNRALSRADALWDTLNVSGLERRLARLLGIGNFSRRNLGSVSYDMYTEVDLTPGDEYRFRIKHPFSNKILLSSSMHYLTPDDAHAEMVLAIERAQQPEGYQRKLTSDGRHYFNIINATGEVIARRIEYFASAELMEAAIDLLIGHLRDYYSGEGMYLIENILLRPEQPDDPFMPICTDADCSDCADADPYSYRLHFVLPAYAGRFCNMDFRRFVEEMIRTETPAHLLPKVCWIGPDDMAAVESAWRDCVSLLAGATRAKRRDKLDALFKALAEAKNVYPPQPLRECNCDPGQPPFMLDRNALGSSPRSTP